MKPNPETGNDASLQKLLREWVVNDPLPPRFEEQVRQRIKQAEGRPESTFFTLLLRALDVALPRPKVAYSYLAVLLLAGVAAGAWAAEKENNRLELTLGTRYLQSVNPFQSALPPR